MVNKSLLSNVAAMAIFGTISVFVKSIALSSGEIAFWRAVIAVAAISLYKLLRREKLSLKNARADILPLILSGIAVGFNWILLFEAYKYTSVSVATLSYYFAPVLIMLLCPILFKEHITKKQAVCFIMATLGLVLIIGARAGGSDKELIGIALGLGAACLYAFIVIMNKKITSVSGTDKTIFQFMVAALVLAVYVPFTSGFQFMGLDGRGLVSMLILGALHTGIAYCLYFSSVGRLSGQKVALFSYVDPLVAVLVSILFLQETVTPWQLVGGAMILGFTLLNEFGSQKESELVSSAAKK
ncbi:MAG: EamA family transporter [Oscillospiraceae bacterium]